ncbi:hypothetical protein GCM10010300_82850 [Streptomyces olivaceoviridis]|nr:hypothetical protein GCM10010300_82850 [Streptomyces olivaceoviridis]
MRDPKTIGEFAARSRPSHKTLRPPADKGLLVPAHVRDVPQQKGAFVHQHVTAEHLAAFLPDGDGPDRGQRPTAAPIHAAGRIGARLEPAHRQAFSELRKEQSDSRTATEATAPRPSSMLHTCTSRVNGRTVKRRQMTRAHGWSDNGAPVIASGRGPS